MALYWHLLLLLYQSVLVGTTLLEGGRASPPSSLTYAQGRRDIIEVTRGGVTWLTEG
jgi:hypothetical protein